MKKELKVTILCFTIMSFLYCSFAAAEDSAKKPIRYICAVPLSGKNNTKLKKIGVVNNTALVCYESGDAAYEHCGVAASAMCTKENRNSASNTLDPAFACLTDPKGSFTLDGVKHSCWSFIFNGRVIPKTMK